MNIKTLTKLIRIKHWSKNALLFFPLLFSGLLMDGSLLLDVAIGFVAFSFMASSIYIINDMKDVAFDRQHPVKRYRPIASGAISRKSAGGVLIVLFLCSAGLGFLLDINFLWILLSYFVLNIFYSYWLKHVSIIDITIIAVGFLLRIFSGGVLANDVYISHWLILMTFLLALFMAIAKRRDDLLIKEKNNVQVRKVIRGYNLPFINVVMPLFASITIVCYIMYTISAEVTERVGTDKVYFTSLPVIVGMLRYLQLTIVEEKSGSPIDILFKDTLIRLMLLIWLVAFFIILYL